MRITTLATAPGGSASVPGEAPVTAGWGPAPGRQFRAVRYLGFSCGTLAEGIVLPEAGAALAAEFLPLDYDALDPPTPLAAAEVREQAGLLRIDLGGVRRVRRVVLARSSRTRGGVLGLYRVDGDGVAGEPAVTAPAGVEHERAEAGSAATSAEPLPGDRAPGHGTPVEAPRVRAIAFDLPDGFDDARFALGVTNGGEVAALGARDLLAVEVRSTPLNPRLGLAHPRPAEPPAPEPDPLDDLLLLWPDPAAPPAPPSAHVEAGGLLASALAAHLSRRVEDLRAGGSPLPTRLDVALVAAADGPCRVRFDDLGVDYHLERRSLNPPHGQEGPADKVVLRFPPGRVEPQPVTMELPAGAEVAAAEVRVAVSRVGGGAGGSRPDAPGSPPAVGGLLVVEGAWAAQRLDLSAPVLAAGVTPGLLDLAEGTELTVEVRADAGGAPAGSLLASGATCPGSLGRARWAGVGFGKAVLLPSGPVWVCLGASRGRAVWLAEDRGPPMAAAVVSAAGRDVAVLQGGCALCSLRPAPAASAASAAGLALEVGGSIVAPVVPDEGPAAFDFAGALRAELARLDGAGSTTVSLGFRSDPGTLLTVYPPRVVYDV